MDQLLDAHRQAIEAAGWTEDEVSAFIADLDAFRAGLGDKQRDLMDHVINLAADTSSDDVAGFLVVPQIISVLIAMPMPAVNTTQKVPGNVRPPSRPSPPPPTRPPA